MNSMNIMNTRNIINSRAKNVEVHECFMGGFGNVAGASADRLFCKAGVCPVNGPDALDHCMQ